MSSPTRKLWLTLLALAVACAVFAYATSSGSGTLTAHFINVGQGDSRHLSEDDHGAAG